MLVILWCCLIYTAANGNGLTTFHNHSIGGKVLFPITSEEFPDSKNYLPIILQADYAIPLVKKNPRHTLSIHFQPQFNPVFVRRGIKDFETGLNIALAYKVWLKYNLEAEIGLGSGPHFLGYDSELQKRGFLFSDNFFFHLNQSIGNDLFLSYELRFRHLSNAGIAEPNVGIDNFFVGIGLSKKLRFKKF